MYRWFSMLGAWFIARLGRLGKTGVFFAHSLLCSVTPPIKFERVVRQIWFVGWKSMLVICLTAVFTGMVLALQGYPTLRRVGSEAFLGPLVALSLIRELGPVLSALMVTGRAGSSIAAEIGVMRTNEQIDALELMGLNPLRYLVAPNLIACLVALPVLASVFNVIAIFGGYLVGVRLLGMHASTYFGEMSNYVEMSDIVGGIYKSMSFGVLIAWVCCYKGYYCRFGAQGVSAATTQAVVNTSALILVWDYFITSLVF
ncbi:MAG: MlaE family lipid ABC transporter permease subunit [Candidatus Omnitrophica bacterium]|nr:MlaE family lipid ABC transporter permease subunit [Candidatus Omnitrophota bacterium]